MLSLAKSKDFPLGEWKILNGSDNPIANGTISDILLVKLAEKANWATLAVR